ncbi:DUF1028 domain-containing protein [Haloferax sp. Atlit-10N]|uniref:DUF1028 domain-containing protein n=1 Tax=unclassified Haloferax TaxID=2625095 RepID=UPI000E278708|nr:MULTISPECIES: DUF1028 domain-containing protein [unclassified Haloferax]RDZ42562.1 DUF1028 domain-containing protein [Haloferax sp. Atlit-16N]RDZ57435.1 DUF1028 domain-containing protein [Haloferax sp. Atlit-10N]
MRHVPGTFSIAARDPDANVFGAAVTTGTVAVGATCPYVSAGGAAVTQSYTKTEHGRDAVARAEAGERIDDAFETLLDADDHAAYRQVHGVGAAGEFAFTGGECVSWAGHRVGDDYTVAGNMLAGEAVVEATAEAYESADGDMADRLVSALEAGEAAGGDDRGEMSAAVLVHAPTPEFYHNLRVDLSDEPVSDLRDLLAEARRAKDQIRRETDAQFGDYPDEILDFGVKY